jgi:hypothetical protein
MAAVDECRRARHFRWKSPQRRPRAERRLARARRQTIDARRRETRPTIVSRIVDARSRGDTRARTSGRARAQNDGRSLCRDVARRARPPTTTRTMRSREICFDPFATRCARESDARARDEGERPLDEC